MKQVLVFVLALLGAALFALGNVLEHRVASRAPDENHLRANLLLYLVRRRVWLIGMAADVSGYLLQATALGLGSLLIVAPLSATGLLFSLGLGAALDGRRLSRRDWIASCTLVAGLVVFLVLGNPHGGGDTAHVKAWLIAGVVLLALMFACVTISRYVTDNARAAFLGVTAGLMYGITAPVTKAVVSQLGHGVLTVLGHWEIYGLAVFSIGGLIVTQSAFQSGSLASALPGLEATEPVVAVALGMGLLGERLTGSTAIEKALIAIAAIAMFSSVVVLARTSGHGVAPAEAAAIEDALPDG